MPEPASIPAWTTPAPLARKQDPEDRPVEAVRFDLGAALTHLATRGCRFELTSEVVPELLVRLQFEPDAVPDSEAGPRGQGSVPAVEASFTRIVTVFQRGAVVAQARSTTRVSLAGRRVLSYATPEFPVKIADTSPLPAHAAPGDSGRWFVAQPSARPADGLLSPAPSDVCWRLMGRGPERALWIFEVRTASGLDPSASEGFLITPAGRIVGAEFTIAPPRIPNGQEFPMPDGQPLVLISR